MVGEQKFEKEEEKNNEIMKFIQNTTHILEMRVFRPQVKNKHLINQQKLMQSTENHANIIAVVKNKKKYYKNSRLTLMQS